MSEIENNQIEVVAKPHPLQDVSSFFYVQEGKTLQEIIEEIQPDEELRRYTNVWVNEQIVLPEMYSTITPTNVDRVVIRCALAGGGDGKAITNMVLTTILAVAVSVFNPGAGVATWAGLSSAWATGLTTAVVNTAILTAGTLAINALVPPYSSDSESYSTTSNYTISAESNTSRPFESLPMILGRHKVFADYAVSGHTEVVGTDTYLSTIFNWGYGPLQIEDIAIEDTPIEDYNDVEHETRILYDPTDPFPIYPTDINEQYVNASINTKNEGVVRTTAIDTTEVSIDFYFPVGLYHIYGDARDKRSAEERNFALEYRENGTDKWYPMRSTYTETVLDDEGNILGTPIKMEYAVGSSGGFIGVIHNGQVYADMAYNNPIGFVRGNDIYIEQMGSSSFDKFPYIRVGYWVSGEIIKSPTSNTITHIVEKDGTLISVPSMQEVGTVTEVTSQYIHKIQGKYLSPFTRTYRYTFPKTGLYDIRITPLEDALATEDEINTTTWSVLRSYSNGQPITKEGLCLTAVKIRATEQLNGTLSGLTGVATTICPDWDKETQTWITRATNNPASLYVYTLTGPFLNKPYEVEEIDIAQMQYWHEYCEANGFECNLVVNTALPLSELLGKIASTGRATSDWLYAKRTVIIDEPKRAKQVVTPRNSSGFSMSKIFTDLPHAWRIAFNNEDKEWLTDEFIVYADGYDSTNATIFESLSFEGVTKASQIYKMGRYYHHVAKLRPETYTFTMDIENLVCRRGDVLIINHDVPSLGIKSARISQVELDEQFDCTSVMLDDFVIYEEGRNYYLRIRYKNGDIESYPIKNLFTGEGIEVEQYKIEFTTQLEDHQIPTKGDLVMVGITEVETAQVLIKSVTPGSDMSATIEAVNYDEDIYSIEEAPEFESHITYSPEYYYNRPKGMSVSINAVITDETAIRRTLDNSLTLGMLVQYTTISEPNKTIGKFEIQWKPHDNDTWGAIETVEGEVYEHLIQGNLQEGEYYDVRVRSYALASSLVGLYGTAGDWATVENIKLIGSTSVPNDITSMRIENRYITWDYPNKPIDFKGYEVRQLGGVAPLWESGTVISDGLITNAHFNVSDKTYGKQVYMVKAVDKNNKYSTNFVYVITDFGAPDILNVKDEVTYSVDWLNMGTVVGGTLDTEYNRLISTPSALFWSGQPTNMFWSGISTNSLWGGSYFDMYYTTNPYKILSNGRLTIQVELESIYGYFLQYRLYQEGVSEEDGWRTWTNTLEVYKGEQYQFKISCYKGNYASIISELKLTNDVPDQSEFFNDILIPEEGLRIPIKKQYARIKTVTYALQTDGNGGITIIVEDKDPINGPLIKVLNNNNEQVPSVIDITVYGVPLT